MGRKPACTMSTHGQRLAAKPHMADLTSAYIINMCFTRFTNVNFVFHVTCDVNLVKRV